MAALPWRQDESGAVLVLLITSRRNGKWMLPKGWPMAGRSDPEAAQVEAMQEAGIVGSVSAAPMGSFRSFKLFDDGQSKPAQTLVYALHVTKELNKWKEKGQRQRKWFTPGEAASIVFEPDLARLLQGLAAGRVPLS
ncbi:hypothetical protein ASD80_07980 [Devosia sp. Root635]|nr:hypothetical protein ASD80_07980 [Devosia sp. Root635]